MNIKNLREFLNTLTEDFDDYQLTVRSIQPDSENQVYVYDNPLYTAIVDEEDKVLYFLDEENRKIYIELTDENETESPQS